MASVEDRYTLEFTQNNWNGENVYMEDRIVILNDISYASTLLTGNCCLAFVCDGHGGDEAADFLTNNFPRTLKETFELMPEVSPDKVLVAAFETLKRRWNNPKSGSTFNGILADLGNGNVWLFNIGDSRTCVYTTDAVHREICTPFHNLENKDELERYEKNSDFKRGVCGIADWSGKPYISSPGGDLAMTRSFGDLKYNPCVFRTLDVKFYPNLLADTGMFIIATDGYYDIYDYVKASKIKIDREWAVKFDDTLELAIEGYKNAADLIQLVKSSTRSTRPWDNTSILIIRNIR